MTRYLVGSCLLAGLLGVFSGCERDAISGPHLAISDAGSPLAQPIQPSIDEHPFVHADPRQAVGGAGGTFGSGGTGGTGFTGRGGTGGTGGSMTGTGATGGTSGNTTGGAAGTFSR